MTKTAIQCPGVTAGSAAPLPLSPAIAVGPFLHVSGQLGVDPISGKLVGEDVTSQTRQTLENIKGLVEAAGMTVADIVKTTIFLNNMEDFPAMNAVYREFFSSPFPARSTVGVALVRPDFLVEIEAIAYKA
jgi:2-iminobutanoate/2-iminopropanoate deaminase